MGQFWAAGLHDATVEQHVNVIGHDVVEDSLVVGHKDNSVLIGAQKVYPVGYYAQGVDIQAGIGLV